MLETAWASAQQGPAAVLTNALAGLSTSDMRVVSLAETTAARENDNAYDDVEDDDGSGHGGEVAALAAAIACGRKRLGDLRDDSLRRAESGAATSKG